MSSMVSSTLSHLGSVPIPKYTLYPFSEVPEKTCSQAVNKSPTHYPSDFARTLRVILFSIHSDEWKSFESQHQTAMRYKRRCCSPIPAESDSLPHAYAQTTKTYYKHQDSRIKKAQELKTKTSANSDIKDPSSETKMQSMSMLAKTQDRKVKKTIKTNKEKI
ncbi:hypothetical protein Tco_1066805 [Tanacetum coccineum]|uniref:DET1- and DDB1-associated protein 1 n=1 Tax=Tanacetum coccineum TaxID=301880 RepID=A0ABQ5HD64_9ASTR